MAQTVNSKKGKVFVQGLFANSATRHIFADRGYEIVERLKDSDLVVWTGGEDINPRLYGEINASDASGHPVSHYSENRDRLDVIAIEQAKDRFKIGICRGAQLLNCIPNGGRLWQHVDHHGGHHRIIDTITQEEHTINSLHHQMMRPGPGAELVAYALQSTIKLAAKDKWTKPSGPNNGTVYNEDDVDVEVLWYPKTRSLLFQAHPEFGCRETNEYFFSLMERYYEAA